MSPLKQVLRVLKNSVEDVVDGKGHDNVAVFYRYRTMNPSGERQLDVKARVRTPDGLAGVPNAWVLLPEFFTLFDDPPTVCWLRDDDPKPFIQIGGVVKGKSLLVNLW